MVNLKGMVDEMMIVSNQDVSTTSIKRVHEALHYKPNKVGSTSNEPQLQIKEFLQLRSDTDFDTAKFTENITASLQMASLHGLDEDQQNFVRIQLGGEESANLNTSNKLMNQQKLLTEQELSSHNLDHQVARSIILTNYLASRLNVNKGKLNIKDVPHLELENESTIKKEFIEIEFEDKSNITTHEPMK